MTQTSSCAKCGGALAANSHDGICPACLLEQGLSSGVTGTDASGALALATTLQRAEPADAADDSTSARAPQIEPGSQIGGYRIVRPLGHGGMGAVYEAEQIDSGRRLALKLLGHSLESPEARKRFFREGRLAASVNHPNSVYVYGTEDLDGTPAISMELVAGGTLQQLVKERGPLPIADAVDTILQVIAGLEAAQALGVLHRDVKPSNCFVDADGTVKVGDFGLSISTTARGESQLTISGVFLGTPAFSSPEQLKGDELDVRSDIYAVGVTLYYLLTGRTPFDADNLVRLLATVLEQPAPSPRSRRSEIPHDLAEVVLRCLEKQPAQRYKSYAELRAALCPFSSAAPIPARLPIRFLAGMLDQLVLTTITFAVQACLKLAGILAISEGTLFAENYFWMTVVGCALELLYFAAPEGLWGASVGKWLCGLRVVNASRSVPGVAPALLRAAIYAVFPSLPGWIALAANPSATFDADSGILNPNASFSTWAGLLNLVLSMSFFPMLALMFSTARRRNGYAGLHDLVSRSRVIVRPRYYERPKLAEREERPTVTDGTAQIGPYHVLETLGADDGTEWLLGYDTRLLRKVWIRRLPLGSPPADAKLSNLARSARLRWLGGKRAPSECWDAYEAATGAPFVAILQQPRPWTRVRYWLFDLAHELAASLKDGTLPTSLGLDRLWITGDGRLKLLDFPAPTSQTSAATEALVTAPGEVGSTRLFLHQVAVSALQGREISADEARQQQSFGPLPLHATQILQGLSRVQRPELAAAQLQSVLHKPASATRRRRWGLLLGCLLPPIFMTMVVVGSLLHVRHQIRRFPTIPPLQKYLARHTPVMIEGEREALSEGEREALEIYIAGYYGDTIRDPEIWSSFYSKMTIPALAREAAERIVAEHPAPTEAEIAQASDVVTPMFANRVTFDPWKNFPLAKTGLLMFFLILLMHVAIPGIVAALLFRGGLMLAMLGLLGVTRTGQRASRLRMFGRALIIWSPVLAMPIVVLLARPAGVEWSVGLAATAITLLTVWSMLLPERGLPDRLAGTYLVPR